MKQFIGKVSTIKLPFMDGHVEAKKLTPKDIRRIQEIAKEMEGRPEEEQSKVLYEILRVAVVGAQEVSDEEFEELPMKELVDLYRAVLREAGVDPDTQEDDSGNRNKD